MKGMKLYNKYNPTAALVLLIIALFLTLVWTMICLDNIDEAFGSSRESVSRWTTLAMVLYADYLQYKDWRTAVALRTERQREAAEAEGLDETIAPKQDKKKEANRRRTVSAIIFLVATAAAVIQISYPGGPSHGWQFSVASAITAGIFLLSALLAEREKK